MVRGARSSATPTARAPTPTRSGTRRGTRRTRPPAAATRSSRRPAAPATSTVSPSADRTHVARRSKIENERGRQEYEADERQPDRAVDEVGVDAEQHAGDERRKALLALAVDEIGHPEGARDESPAEVVHRCPIRLAASARRWYP